MKMGPEPGEACRECGKMVSDSEWVCNWMSCNECFDKQLEKFPPGDPISAEPGDL